MARAVQEKPSKCKDKTKEVVPLRRDSEKKAKRSINRKISRVTQEEDEDESEAEDTTSHKQNNTGKSGHQMSKQRTQPQKRPKSNDNKDRHEYQLTLRGQKRSVPKTVPEEKSSKKRKINERSRLNGDEQNKVGENQVMEIMQVDTPLPH